MSTLIDSQILNSFSLTDLLFYMYYQSGWSKVESSSGWNVFVSDKTVSPIELEVVLPNEYDEHTAPTYIATALDLLCSLKKEDPQILAQSISRYESDLLYVRNTRVNNSSSIELDVAARQLQDLRNLVRQAADMETRKEPYDLATHSIEANRLANHYRFGHTFQGSFGYTLESPLMTQAEKGIQRPLGEEYSKSEIPLSRRVMERIARGLIFVSESANEQTTERIVSNFLTGFNANMCSSIASVSTDQELPVEYRIIWSPIIRAESDIADFPSILVDSDELLYLQRAENELKELSDKPSVSVRGRVLSIGTTDAPLGDAARLPRSPMNSGSN